MLELPLGSTFASSVVTNHMVLEMVCLSSKKFLQILVEAYQCIMFINKNVQYFSLITEVLFPDEY